MPYTVTDVAGPPADLGPCACCPLCCNGGTPDTVYLRFVGKSGYTAHLPDVVAMPLYEVTSTPRRGWRAVFSAGPDHPSVEFRFYCVLGNQPAITAGFFFKILYTSAGTALTTNNVLTRATVTCDPYVVDFGRVWIIPPGSPFPSGYAGEYGWANMLITGDP